MNLNIRHTLLTCCSILSLLFYGVINARAACGSGGPTITNLPPIPNSGFQVYGLSSAGEVTGFFFVLGVHNLHAFTYQEGVLTDLGTLGGDTSIGYSINASGQVAGKADLGTGQTHAFLYSGGVMSDLGTLGGTSSSAAAINDAGQVVGEAALVGDAGTNAFLFANGGMVNLGTLGSNYSSAFALNNTGVVVGESAVANGDIHGFIYAQGAMSDLGTLGGNYSSAFAVNANGVAVGESTVASGDIHAFVYAGGTMTDIGSLGGTYSSAFAVNTNGQVAGNSSLPGDVIWHGLFYDNGVTIDLGTLGGDNSSFWALNNLGQIVGDSDTATGVKHAFLWANGQMTDLNQLLPADSGWELLTAQFINDSGRIAGYGYHGGSPQWFIMDLGGDNHSPVAVAGPDQTVDCQSQVTLNGSASNDSDNDPLTFEWTFGGAVLGTNALLTISLPLGTNVVTLKVSDPCNGSSQANVVVAVLDTTPPTISCPTDLSTASDANCQARVPDFVSQMVVSDNCTPTASLKTAQDPLAGTMVGLGPHNIAIQVTDNSGNNSSCNVIFTVQDMTPPIISSVPPPVSVSAGDDCQGVVPNVLGSLVASDTCTPADQLNMSQSPAAGSMLGTGQYTIVVTVSDASGNSAAANVPLSVSDTSPPNLLSVPGPITVSAGVNCQASVPYLVGSVLAGDNCTAADQLLITQNPTAGTLLPLGQYLVTITATDAAGNTTSAGVSLTVTNTSSPVIPALAGYGIFQLGNGKVSISGGRVSGDAAVGPKGAFASSGSAVLTGTLFLAAGDTFSRSGSAVIGNIVQNADLTTAINATVLTSAADAQLECAQNFTSWKTSKVINGVAGDNVICVQNVTLAGGNRITLNAPAGARFIINVLGSFSLSGSSTIRVSGGLSPNAVLYNIIGTGNDVAFSGSSAVDGSVLAVSRNVNLSGGFVNGQVISGKNVALSSGQINSTVGCTQ